MGGEDEGLGAWPPAPSGAPLYLQKEDHWTHFDNSVNAISFGFVATVILISMFLVMAIFEKFLRTTSPALSSAGGRRSQSDIEAHNRIGGFNAKLGYPSPKVSICLRFNQTLLLFFSLTVVKGLTLSLTVLQISEGSSGCSSLLKTMKDLLKTSPSSRRFI